MGEESEGAGGGDVCMVVTRAAVVVAGEGAGGGDSLSEGIAKAEEHPTDSTASTTPTHHMNQTPIT